MNSFRKLDMDNANTKLEIRRLSLVQFTACYLEFVWEGLSYVCKRDVIHDLYKEKPWLYGLFSLIVHWQFTQNIQFRDMIYP